MEILRRIPIGRKGFATAVDCMDGRTKGPVSKLIRQETRAKFVDTVTGPGIVAKLAAGDQATTEQVRERVEISVNHHKSKGIVVGGHAECAGNPTDRDTHISQVKTAVEMVRSMVGNHEIPVIGVFTEPRKTLFRKKESKRRRWIARQVA
jgi:Putative carbonic anhydrase